VEVFVLADLDLAKAAGGSVFSVSGTTEPGFLVFIPIKGGKTTYDKIKAKIESDDMVSWFQDGYILVSNKGNGISGPIQKKSKAVAALKLVGKDAITVWVDLDQLRTAYKDQFEKFKNDFTQELLVSPGASQEEIQSKASMEVLKKAALDFADQTKIARLDFLFNTQGVVLKAFLDFEKGIGKKRQDSLSGVLISESRGLSRVLKWLMCFCAILEKDWKKQCKC
jgi:hypothetical protein